MRQPALPNFFVVGTGKAGTTSLYRYLKQHPQIYMSPVKEPGYFASEIRAGDISAAMQGPLRRQSRELSRYLDDGKPVKPLGWLVSDWEDYLRLFHNVRQEKAIGEASAAYLWSETAAGNIHAVIPEAKIIMILRDPADRAFSQYLHQLAAGLTRSSFREHVEVCLRGAGRKLGIYYPFLEVGLYYQQVKRYLDLFPQDRVRVYWYEEAWRQPSLLLTDLFQFLSVDPAFHPDTSRKELERRAPRLVTPHYFLKKLGIWYPLKACIPHWLRSGLARLAFRNAHSLTLDPKDRQYLIDYYREDVQKLASLLKRDLSAWLR